MHPLQIKHKIKAILTHEFFTKVVEGSRNFDRLRFFNVHINLRTQAYSIFTFIEKAASKAGISSCDLRVRNGVP